VNHPAVASATVLIATYNRAALLDETLASLARMRVSPGLAWDAIVVDNNSSDETRAVVERHIPAFPVRLQYLFEGRQGRSSALNAGIREATGTIVAMTDDDVRVEEGWLDAACAPLLGGDPAIGYSGGPIRPIWGAPPPRWLDLERGDLWGTIAIQNHGAEAFVYEERRKVPLGANMAMRRDLFARIGGFRADLGRTGGRLVLGQEVPELLRRARAAGVHGVYVPTMVVHHHIPAARLHRAYFRRWWFGKGVSRSALDRMQPLTELDVDLRATPHFCGVPRFMYGSLVRDLLAMAAAWVARRPAEAFRREMMVAFFAGYAWARWQNLFTSDAPTPGSQSVKAGS
jgi:glycosyltransferase involved in cell wall biosynthesis